jgi:hypothetical protein
MKEIYMTNKFKLIIASLMLSIVYIEPASAIGSLRCGTHIIQAGGDFAPGQYEVLKRCGEPDSRSGRVWMYKKGSVTKVLTFGSNGTLQRVD